MTSPSFRRLPGIEIGNGDHRIRLDLFFDLEGRLEQRVSSGSGVIFSNDGYIISNNHVIQESDRIEVIVGKQTYQASVIGADPSTDIAVLKIEVSDLHKIPLGSSKNLKVGEWVIAVGNPFNLTSTVTAGIVSAKGREINILKGKFAAPTTASSLEISITRRRTLTTTGSQILRPRSSWRLAGV